MIAYLHNTMVRGYVQDFRVITDLPEPTAELHQVVAGDTAEKLAAQRFGAAVTDGHDLRYYEAWCAREWNYVRDTHDEQAIWWLGESWPAGH